MKTHLASSLLAAILSAVFAAELRAQTTSFIYQGRLIENGGPVTGLYDFRFILYSSDQGGNQRGPILTRSATPVGNGLFAVALDFGDVFDGEDYWLDIAVRAEGAGAFTPLVPRQPLTSTPYAIQAKRVGEDGLSGTHTRVLNLSNPANTMAGSFVGSGADLTDLDANQITSGNLNPARLPTGGHWSPTALLFFDSLTMVLDPAANRVGIGTASPTAKLDVFTDTTGAFNNTAVFRAPNIGPHASSVHYGTNGDWYVRSANPAGKVVLQDSGGRVGIGTTSPAGKLDVLTDTTSAFNNTALFRAPNIGPHASSVHYGTTGDWYIRSASESGKLVLQDTGGQVAIGTTSPSGNAKLTVAGGRTVIEQEPWQMPTFVNSWTNVGLFVEELPSPGYFKDSMGIVHLRGRVSGGTNATVFFLPAGYRPDQEHYQPIFGFRYLGGPSLGWAYVNQAGRVDVYDTGDELVALDGITFRAAD